MKMDFHYKENTYFPSIVIIIVFGILFYAQDYWFISDWDDIFYKFVITDKTQGYVPQLFDGKHQYVESFGDVLLSQWNHYFGSNGRFIVHCIVQVCTTYLTSHQFAFLNSIALVLLLGGMVKLVDDGKKIQTPIIMSLFLSICAPSTIAAFFANMAWSVNYLWSASATIWWLMFYENVCIKEKKYSQVQLILIALFGIIVGSLQEGFCIGICFGIGLWQLITIKKISWPKVIIISSYCLGALICVVSPANFRKAGGRISGIQIDAILDILLNYSILIFSITLCLAILLSRKKIYKFINQNAPYIFAIAFNIGFGLFLVYNGFRQYTLSVLLCTVVFCRLVFFYNTPVVKCLKYTFITIGLISLGIFYPQMYEMRKELGKAYYSIYYKEMKEKNRIVNDGAYENMRDKISDSFLNNYFVIFPFNGTEIDHYMSIHVSRGRDMNYITAVLPVELNDLIDTCKKNADSTGIMILCKHVSVCCLEGKQDLKNVKWKYKTTFRNPNKFHDATMTPLYRLQLEDKYYYIFHTSSRKIISEKLLVDYE